METDIIKQKTAKDCAIPEIRAWLNAAPQVPLKHQRAIEMLTCLHMEAWKPPKQHYDCLSVRSLNDCGQGHIANTAVFHTNFDGYVIFTSYRKRYAASQITSLLYSHYSFSRQIGLNNHWC
jgi:hypothetical protein